MFCNTGVFFLKIKMEISCKDIYTVLLKIVFFSLPIFLKPLLNFPWENDIINYFFFIFHNVTKSDVDDVSFFRRSLLVFSHVVTFYPVLSKAVASGRSIAWRIALQVRHLCFIYFYFYMFFQFY